jgi:hypothetical protein
MRRAREASARGEVIDVDAPSEVIVIQDDSESEASLVCRPKKVGKKQRKVSGRGRSGKRAASPAPAPAPPSSKATRAKADARAAMEARLKARLARKK